jgi:hypothetical protein
LWIKITPVVLKDREKEKFPDTLLCPFTIAESGRKVMRNAAGQGKTSPKISLAMSVYSGAKKP